jgi:hypothetical protein
MGVDSRVGAGRDTGRAAGPAQAGTGPPGPVTGAPVGREGREGPRRFAGVALWAGVALVGCHAARALAGRGFDADGPGGLAAGVAAVCLAGFACVGAALAAHAAQAARRRPDPLRSGGGPPQTGDTARGVGRRAGGGGPACPGAGRGGARQDANRRRTAPWPG